MYLFIYIYIIYVDLASIAVFGFGLLKSETTG
jgi:hypothetical protein